MKGLGESLWLQIQMRREDDKIKAQQKHFNQILWSWKQYERNTANNYNHKTKESTSRSSNMFVLPKSTITVTIYCLSYQQMQHYKQQQGANHVKNLTVALRRTLKLSSIKEKAWEWTACFPSRPLPCPFPHPCPPPPRPLPLQLVNEKIGCVWSNTEDHCSDSQGVR